MRAFTHRLIRLRSETDFRRRDFLRGQPVNDSGPARRWWFRVDGRRDDQPDWERGEAVLGMFLNGQAIQRPGRTARRSRMTRSCCCSTPTPRTGSSSCRAARMGARWELELDRGPDREPGSVAYDAAQLINVMATRSRS